MFKMNHYQHNNSNTCIIALINKKKLSNKRQNNFDIHSVHNNSKEIDSNLAVLKYRTYKGSGKLSLDRLLSNY